MDLKNRFSEALKLLLICSYSQKNHRSCVWTKHHQSLTDEMWERIKKMYDHHSRRYHNLQYLEKLLLLLDEVMEEKNGLYDDKQKAKTTLAIFFHRYYWGKTSHRRFLDKSASYTEGWLNAFGISSNHTTLIEHDINYGTDVQAETFPEWGQLMSDLYIVALVGDSLNDVYHNAFLINEERGSPYNTYDYTPENWVRDLIIRLEKGYFFTSFSLSQKFKKVAKQLVSEKVEAS